MMNNKLEIVNKLKVALSLSAIICLNSINAAYLPLSDATISGFVDPALFRSMAMQSKTLSIADLGYEQRKMLSDAAGKFLTVNKCVESKLMREVNVSLLFLKQGIGPFNVAMQNIVSKYGDTVSALATVEQITYAIARSIESFFAGDLILTASFCLHARQLSLTLKQGTVPLNDLATSFITIIAQSNMGKTLTENDISEERLLRLHLSKLFTSKSAQQFFVQGTSVALLLNPQQLLRFRERNNLLHGHTVYLLAQLACSNRKANPEQIIAMVKDNHGFFQTPEQKDSSYRESAQRLYAAALEMRLPDSEHHALRDLIEFTRITPTWDSMLKIPLALEILDKLFVKYDSIAPDEFKSICEHYTGPSERLRYSKGDISTFYAKVSAKKADIDTKQE